MVCLTSFAFDVKPVFDFFRESQSRSVGAGMVISKSLVRKCNCVKRERPPRHTAWKKLCKPTSWIQESKLKTTTLCEKDLQHL